MSLELHPNVLVDNEWWACSEPERPGDYDCVFDPDCPKCEIKKEVEIRREPFANFADIWHKDGGSQQYLDRPRELKS